MIAQAAIDNAKRRFDIDLMAEINRIKEDMNISDNKFPKFWFILKRKGKFNKTKKNGDNNNDKNKNENKIGDLICPMNYIYDIDFNNKRSDKGTLPMSEFFVKFPMDESKRKAKKIEDLIEKYSFDLYSVNVDHNMNETHLLLMENFDDLIEDIRQSSMSKRYVGLMSWLIDRAFAITPQIKGQKNIHTTISKNRSLLMKILYDVNKDAFLACFSKNVIKDS